MKIPNSFHFPFTQENIEHWRVLDSTKLQAYAACPRQYFFEYVMGWRADRASNHLVFGQAWHSALEYLYKTGMDISNIPTAFEKFLEVYRREWPESTDSWFGGKTPEAALSALIEYVQTNSADLYTYDVLATEVVDFLPITGEDNLVVKLDAVLQNKKTGVITIIDHKTGSSSGQWWARQWHLSLQMGAYIAACNHFYNQKSTPCIVDGVFFLKTKRNFQRELVQKSETQMENWGRSVVGLLIRIEHDFSLLEYQKLEQSTLECFLQNPVSCEKYGGCQFYDLCECMVNPLAQKEFGPPSGFKEEWWNPLQA